MNDLVEMMRADAGAERVKREAAAAQTRANFPEPVAFAQLFEPKFGPVKLIHAEQNGRSTGKAPTPGMDWFATPTMKQAATVTKQTPRIAK